MDVIYVLLLSDARASDRAIRSSEEGNNYACMIISSER